MNILKRKNQKGASMVEYALLLALVSVVSITILTTLGTTMTTSYTSVNAAVNTANG
nr:Flp family type IVb pilin [Rhodospirillales bacterium]